MWVSVEEHREDIPKKRWHVNPEEKERMPTYMHGLKTDSMARVTETRGALGILSIYL